MVDDVCVDVGINDVADFGFFDDGWLVVVEHLVVADLLPSLGFLCVGLTVVLVIICCSSGSTDEVSELSWHCFRKF